MASQIATLLSGGKILALVFQTKIGWNFSKNDYHQVYCVPLSKILLISSTNNRLLDVKHCVKIRPVCKGGITNISPNKYCFLGDYMLSSVWIIMVQLDKWQWQSLRCEWFCVNIYLKWWWQNSSSTSALQPHPMSLGSILKR